MGGDRGEAGGGVNMLPWLPSLTVTKADTGGHWVTIHGAHVYIENGKITKGPDHLVGKKPSEVDGSKKPSKRTDSVRAGLTPAERHHYDMLSMGTPEERAAKARHIASVARPSGKASAAAPAGGRELTRDQIADAVGRGLDDQDPLGQRKAGFPDGHDRADFHARVGELAREFDAARGHGLTFDEAYKAAGKGMSKSEFARALVDAHDAGAVRLSGFGQSVDEIPDPALAVVLGEKVYYRVQPGDKPAGPKPAAKPAEDNSAGDAHERVAAELNSPGGVMHVADLRKEYPHLTDEQLAAGIEKLADEGKLRPYADMNEDQLKGGGVQIGERWFGSVGRIGGEKVDAADLRAAFGAPKGRGKALADFFAFGLPLLTKAGQWDESKHKRGQPENAGQFGPGGGGAGGPSKTPRMGILVSSGPSKRSGGGASAGAPPPPPPPSPGALAAPGKGPPPKNLGSPTTPQEHTDQLIWLLGRASELRRRGREGQPLTKDETRELVLSINLASRLRSGIFQLPQITETKPEKKLPVAQFAPPEHEAPATTTPADTPSPAGKLTDVRQAIEAHGGDSGKATEAIRQEISQHLAAGGSVSLWVDGKQVPVAKVDQGRIYDAKDQPWGLLPLAMGTKGKKNGVEFHDKPPASSATSTAKPSPTGPDLRPNADLDAAFGESTTSAPPKSPSDIRGGGPDIFDPQETLPRPGPSGKPKRPRKPAAAKPERPAPVWDRTTADQRIARVANRARNAPAPGANKKPVGTIPLEGVTTAKPSGGGPLPRRAGGMSVDSTDAALRDFEAQRGERGGSTLPVQHGRRKKPAAKSFTLPPL